MWIKRARLRGDMEIWLGREVEDPLAVEPATLNKFLTQRKSYKMNIHLKPRLYP